MLFARQLVELGVDIIEAGFPISSVGDFEAVHTICAELSGIRVAALARAREGDIRRAAEALAPASHPRIHTFIATSDIHLRHKLGMSRQQALDATVAAVTLAREFVEDVQFSAEDATRTDPDYLIAVCRAAVEAGAGTVNIPDTVGHTLPDEYGAVIRRVVEAIGDRARVSTHCHDDLGLAVANSLAALQAGAHQVECTLNGIGERAGNCALEEVVMILQARREHLAMSTNVVSRRLYPTSRMLAELIGFGPQPNKAIVGANAFAHEAGIHQDGMIKERTTYEILDPSEVGVPESRLILGKHSGRNALSQRCRQLGFDLDNTELARVYRRFTEAADRNKRVNDEELRAIVRGAVSGGQTWASLDDPLDVDPPTYEPTFFL